MKRTFMTVISVVAVLLVASSAVAQQDLVEAVVNGCEAEMEKFCNQVTPGEGRMLACLFAHGDKLSPKCEYALYDAAVQLERAVAALGYVANECDADLEKHCSSVAAGEGRLLKCLEKTIKKSANGARMH